MNDEISALLIQASQEKASEMGIAVCIAIVDDGAILKQFHRMDNAFKGSVDVAISKARTSALFPLPSGDFGELIRSAHLTGMENTNGGMSVFAGGFPIFQDGVQLGAIGISGGSAEEDASIASYALNALTLLSQNRNI